MSPAIGVVIATVGNVVVRVKVTGVLLPVLPAASVSCATMLFVPLPDSVTLVDQAPPLPTVAVPTWVVTPFTVSSRITVEPIAAPPAAAVTVPEIVCVAWLVVIPAVLTATVGAASSSVNTTEVLVLLAAASSATMVCEPYPASVTLVLQTPPGLTVVVPSAVVTPL